MHESNEIERWRRGERGGEYGGEEGRMQKGRRRGGEAERRERRCSGEGRMIIGGGLALEHCLRQGKKRRKRRKDQGSRRTTDCTYNIITQSDEKVYLRNGLMEDGWAGAGAEKQSRFRKEERTRGGSRRRRERLRMGRL